MAAQGVDGSVVIEVVADDSRFQQQINALANTIGNSIGSAMDDAIARLNNSLSQIGSNADSAGRNVGDSFGTGSYAHNSVSNLSTVMQNAFGHLLADAIENIGRKIYEVGQQAWQAGVNFESAFAGVKKTVDETASVSYADLEKQLRDMSLEVPSTIEEISGVAEAAGQLGIEAPQIKEFTRTMIDLGESTNLSAEMAASELAKFANITKLSKDEYGNLGATIVDLGNNFATTERDIVNMSQRLAATAHAAGINEQGILALSTALSSVGIEAEAGGTAMSTFIKKVQTAVETQSKALSQYAEIAGMTSEEFTKAFKTDGVTAINAFITGLSKLDESGGSSLQVLNDMGLKEVRLSNAILALSGSQDMLTRTYETANKAWEEGTALQEEAAKRYETTESQISMLKNSINDLFITLSQNFTLGLDVSPITNAVKQINDAFKKGGFDGMLDAMQDIFNISDNTVSAIKDFAEQLPSLISAASDALITILHSIEEVTGDFLSTFVDIILPKLIDGLEWISEHGETINGLLKAFISYFVIEKVKGFADVIGGQMITAFSGLGDMAATTAGKVSLAVAALEAAYVVGTAIAESDWYRDLGYTIGGGVYFEETDRTKELEEQTSAYREQYNVLREMSKTNPMEAYAQSKDELAGIAVSYAQINKEYEDLRAKIASGGYVTEGGGFHQWTEAESAALNSELQSLSIQKDQLFALKTEMKDIIDSYGSFYETGLPDNMGGINEKLAEERAKKYSGLFKEETNQASKEVETFLSEEEAKHLHYLAEIAKESGEITEAEYYDRIENIANQLDMETQLYEQYNKEVVKGRRKLAESLEKETQKAYKTIYSEAKTAVKNELSEVKKGLKELVSAYEDTYDDIIKNRDNYKSRLMGESVFSVTTETDKETGEVNTTYSIDNLKKRLEEREKYAKEIDNLRKRKINDNLLSELESLDMDQSMIFAKQLNKMSDEEFTQLNEAYKKLDDTTTQLANDRYASELESLQKGFISEAEALFDGLSEDLKNAGMNSIMAYIEGFDVKKEDAFKALENYTNDIIDNINSGLSANTVDISNTIAETLGDTNIGESLVDNIVSAITDNQDNITSALETILSNTGIDLDIKTDMENRATTASQSGYTAANRATTSNYIPQTSNSSQSVVGGKIKVEVTGKITDKGERVIADIVNKRNAEIEIQGGT